MSTSTSSTFMQLKCIPNRFRISLIKNSKRRSNVHKSAENMRLFFSSSFVFSALHTLQSTWKTLRISFGGYQNPLPTSPCAFIYARCHTPRRTHTHTWEVTHTSRRLVTLLKQQRNTNAYTTTLTHHACDQKGIQLRQLRKNHYYYFNI